jgi:hypothetical protein
MAERNEWLTLLLDSMVSAAQNQPGYAREDLDQFLDQFTVFARGEIGANGHSVEAEGRVIRIGEAIVQALEEVAMAERNPASSRWDEALACWRQAADELAAIYVAAEQEHSTPLAGAAGSLELWINTVGEIYCVLRVSLDPWADITGHSGDVVIRQLDALERRILRYWQRNRYQFYSLLGRRYSRWAQFARRRGWVTEADALDFLVSRTRMRTLAAYLRHGRRSIAAPPLPGETPTAPTSAALSRWADWWDRAGVLGRLGIDGFYYSTAGFGYRPARLVWINLLVVFGFGLLYWGLHLLQFPNPSPDPTAPANVVIPDTFKGFLQAEYFSALAFMLAALGEITPVGTLGQFVIVLESIWGFLMISVVIATVVNRNTTSPM